MIQSQVWKKRSAGLTGEFRGEATNWLCPKERDRESIMATPAGKQPTAGVKSRKY